MDYYVPPQVVTVEVCCDRTALADAVVWSSANVVICANLPNEEVAEARRILARGDFMGVEKSEELLASILNAKA